MANVADDKASVLRTTKVRTKLKGDGSWLNRNSDTEETTEEKPWLAEIRARRENGESSPVSSPTSSPLPKPDSDKLPTSGFKIRGVFNQVDKSSTSSTSNGISSDTSHITKISSDSYKKIAPHTVKPPAENANSTISSEEQDKRTTAASKALPKTAARERSYVLSAAKKFESQEQAADKSVDDDTTSFVAKRVKVTEEASSNPPPRRSALLSPVAPVPEPKPLNRVGDGVKKTVGHVTFSETTKVEEVPPDREHTFPPPPPPVLAPTKDLMKDMTPDLDDSGDDDTYSVSVHEQVKKFTSKSQPEREPEPEPFQNSSSRVEALAAMYENLIPSETETSSLKGGEWVLAGKEKDQEDDDSEEGDGQEPTAGLSNHKATTENLRDLFSGKEKDALSSHVTTTVTEYSKKKDPLSSHVTSTVTEYSREDSALPAPPSPKRWSKEVTFESKEKDPLSSNVTTTVTEYSREDRTLPVPPSPGRLSQDLLTEIESREDRALPVPPSPGRLSQDLLTEIESREDPALPVPPSPGRLSQDLLTEIESREDRTLPVPPSPGRLSQDWLTEIESREDRTLPVPPSPGRLSQDWLTEIESREDPALPVPPSPGRLSQDLLTELESREDPALPVPPSPGRLSQDLLTELESREDPALPVPPSPKRLSQDWLTEIESKEKDPMSSHVTTTVTEYSREEPALPVPPSPGRLRQDLLTELESKEKDPLSSHVTTTVTEYSKEKDPLSSYGTTTVTEYSREEPALPSPRSPKRWSKDRLTELESPTKTHSDFTVTTETVTTSIDSEEKDPLSSRSTTTVTKFSSADAYDPYPIGTTSRNSSSDLLKPISDLSINSSSTSFTEKKDPEIMMSGKATVSFADDITPFDTHATSLSTHRSWARKWETTTPLQTHIEESREDLAEAGEEDQQTLVTFERKSKEDDSPWDKWTSPSVYTLTTTTEEEEEEERYPSSQSLEDSQVHTVTTITTIRDSYGRQEEYGMNRTRLQEVPRTPSPDPESKKPFVYLKEYINTTELSSHNASDSMNSWSSSYSSSPSTLCTYCGQLVTNDAMITIEHLNLNCHPSCFKCYSCHKPMGDLVFNMFLHGGKVHCEICYSAALD
ncbi:zinc finger protein 185 isoform X47 [Entelurus aequoreus]|uniref:zinc finger protein 185 isoform X47 n=1 Tax=Entelurus aequoreus TaxID=161455 RepID=UPI002B1E33D7|nr:zinc finger protein 185 isoform X47 [Entelurus aequoreus]